MRWGIIRGGLPSKGSFLFSIEYHIFMSKYLLPLHHVTRPRHASRRPWICFLICFSLGWLTLGQNTLSGAMNVAHNASNVAPKSLLGATLGATASHRITRRRRYSVRHVAPNKSPFRCDTFRCDMSHLMPKLFSCQIL